MHATESKYQLSIHWGEDVQSWNKVCEIVKACETKSEKGAFKLKALLLTTRFVTGTRLVARVRSLVRCDVFVSIRLVTAIRFVARVTSLVRCDVFFVYVLSHRHDLTPG